MIKINRRNFLKMLTYLVVGMPILAQFSALWTRTRPRTSKQERLRNNMAIRVLIYEGSTLPKSFPIRIVAKGIDYQGKLFPPTNSSYGRTVIIPIKNEIPIVYKKNAYAGKMIVVRKDQKVFVVNELGLDDYLMGVVKKEISSSWHHNAIKAQAVAARSYAYNHLKIDPTALYHISSTTNHQVFGGSAQIAPSIRKGVLATSGFILLDKIGKKPVQSFFHACCGGMTAKAEKVWNSDVRFSYFKNIRCPHCTTHPLYKWERKFSMQKINSALNKFSIDRVRSVSIKSRTGSKRVDMLVIKAKSGTHTIDGNKFRVAVSPREIPSTRFNLKASSGGYKLVGRGFGHGVGLCQWGAKTMAEKGYSHTAILNFYYKNCTPITLTKYHKRYA